MRIAAIVAVTIAVGGASLAGCASDSTPPDEAADQKPAVVASTDVWGSVASAVAGDNADVTSIITSSGADPHSFEASPADAAEITDASLVVYNGGGYDQWVDDVLATNNDVQTVEAYSLLHTAAEGEPGPSNEHVFYDIGTAKAVANQIAEKLSADDPGNAESYRSNAAEFGRRADTVATSERDIAAANQGAAVVATEPVAHYLVLAAGLKDLTPEGFSSAIEEDADPAPADVAAMLDLIRNRQVAVVLFNPQTETPATKQVQSAAQESGVAILDVTETLPPGTDYLTWQQQTVDQLAGQLANALNRAP